MPYEIDFDKLLEDHQDLIESMAWVAFGKVYRPSYDLDDLIQEGRMVCIEWVRRWYDPSKGASLRTFITAGLRNHYADLIKKSFRNATPNLETHETDLRKRSGSLDPLDVAMFQEKYSRILTVQQKEYIELLLSCAQSRSNPREHVRNQMGLSITVEEYLRKDIRERLSM